MPDAAPAAADGVNWWRRCACCPAASGRCSSCADYCDLTVARTAQTLGIGPPAVRGMFGRVDNGRFTPLPGAPPGTALPVAW